MRLTWHGHACFRLEGSGLSIVTDPYTPAPGRSGLPPLPDDPPDIVLMSSADDEAHSCWQSVPGSPQVVNALDAVDAAVRLSDTVELIGIAAREGTERPDEPSRNAMYVLTLDGLTICHMGDIGTPLSNEQLRVLAGRVDVLLALAGGGLTIPLPDLDDAIEAIGPAVVVPMHYRIPGLRYQVGTLGDFLARRRHDRLVEIDGSTVELSRTTLPSDRTTIVLQPLARTSAC